MKEKKGPIPGDNEATPQEPGEPDLAADAEAGIGEGERPDAQPLVSTGERAPATEAIPHSKESEYLEDLRRISAEFANYRRRVQRERADWEARAKGELLVALLPVLDDFYIARGYWSGREVGKEAEGMLMILARLEEALRSSGLEVQDTEPGTPFDPHRHEAIAAAPSEEYPEGMIIDTYRRGYTYRDILLRPARVRVSQGPAADAP